ncbi:MAG: hypothetical protein QOE26_2741 [Verrucomicrobiota bacterium]|jgi:hypothetical protein
MTEDDQKWLDEQEAPRNRAIWEERNPSQPILDFLEDQAQIIEVVGMTSDKREIVICEACDRYFTATFNKAQFKEFIAALEALHQQMQP